MPSFHFNENTVYHRSCDLPTDSLRIQEVHLLTTALMDLRDINQFINGCQISGLPIGRSIICILRKISPHPEKKRPQSLIQVSAKATEK